MAQHQSGTSGGKSTQGQSGMQGASGMQGTSTQGRTQTGDHGTGIDNVTYDIVSVVYHALQAAQTYQQYERDAQRGEPQIADFFRRVCDNNKQCAEEGLRLLQECLGGQQGGQQMRSGEQGQAGQAGQSGGQYGRGTQR